MIRTRAPTKGLAPQASAFDQALPPPHWRGHLSLVIAVLLLHRRAYQAAHQKAQLLFAPLPLHRAVPMLLHGR